jgi:hypothetical protein
MKLADLFATRTATALLPALALSCAMVPTAMAEPVVYTLETTMSGTYAIPDTNYQPAAQTPVKIVAVCDTNNIVVGGVQPPFGISMPNDNIQGLLCDSIQLTVGNATSTLNPADYSIETRWFPGQGSIVYLKYVPFVGNYTFIAGFVEVTPNVPPFSLSANFSGTGNGANQDVLWFLNSAYDYIEVLAESTTPSFQVKLGPLTQPFASFAPAVNRKLKESELEMTATFKLGTGSNGALPATEALTVAIGAYSVTVPAGSLKKGKGNTWSYSTKRVGSVQKKVSLALAANGTYTVKAELYDTKAALDVVPKGVAAEVSVTLGDDTGKKTVLVR